MTEAKADTKPATPVMDSADIFMAFLAPFVNPFLGREPNPKPEKKAVAPTIPTQPVKPLPQELKRPPTDAEPVDTAADRKRHYTDNKRIDDVFIVTSLRAGRLVRLRALDYCTRPELTFLNEREVDEFIEVIRRAKLRAFGRS